MYCIAHVLLLKSEACADVGCATKRESHHYYDIENWSPSVAEDGDSSLSPRRSFDSSGNSGTASGDEDDPSGTSAPPLSHTFLYSSSKWCESRFFINATDKAATLFLLCFNSQIRMFLPDIANHIKKLGMVAQDFCRVWFQRMFVTLLPITYCDRIMDLFLLEGNPILHRVGMSILSLLQERLLATGHSSEFAQILLGAGTLPLSKILSTAVQFELSRRQVHRLYLNNICCWKKTYEVNTLMFHRPLFNYDSSIVTRQEIEAIWFWMPRRFHTKEPELIFTTSVDGYSLGTFLRKCKGHEQSVLLIRTKYDHQLQYFHLVLQFSFLNSSDFKLCNFSILLGL